VSNVSRTVRLTNRRGLHARASARFVTLATAQPAAVEVEKDGSRVCGTSIMGLMMLGAAFGDEITISAEGEGAEEAVAVLAELVEDRFGED
jgi:phosphocarrier protein